MVALYDFNRKLSRLIDCKFIPVESKIHASLQRSICEEQDRLQLAKSSGIRDEKLISKLLIHGVRADNFTALPVLPVALVAWASGSVCWKEARAAEQAIANTEYSINALLLIKSWLQTRPNPELTQLWESYTFEREAIIGLPESQRIGRSVYNVAQKVAAASGGFLGFGSICQMERDILERIKTVHRLEVVSDERDSAKLQSFDLHRWFMTQV